MTETIIIALLLTAAVWLWRVCRRSWCRLRGIEHDPAGEGPLPIVRVWHLVRAWWYRLWGWLRRRPGPAETE